MFPILGSHPKHLSLNITSRNELKDLIISLIDINCLTYISTFYDILVRSCIYKCDDLTIYMGSVIDEYAYVTHNDMILQRPDYMNIHYFEMLEAI